MLAEAMQALAAAGGAAVVQAAGTDAWTGFRSSVAGWFGRGDPERERVERDRLDRTAAVLRDAPPNEVARLTRQQEADWQGRFAASLEDLDETVRQAAAAELHRLLPEPPPPAGPMAGPGGLAVGGSMSVQADGGIAAGVIHGGTNIGNPPPPDPYRG